MTTNESILKERQKRIIFFFLQLPIYAGTPYVTELYSRVAKNFGDNFAQSPKCIHGPPMLLHGFSFS